MRNIKTVKQSINKGFTLIELMITVAIVGILAAVAMPAYENYTIRAQASEAFSLNSGLQTAIQEYYANNGIFPSSITDIGLQTFPTGKYGADYVIANGAISFKYGFGTTSKNVNQKLNGGVLTMTPYDDGNGNIHWKCQGNYIFTGHAWLPTSCTNN